MLWINSIDIDMICWYYIINNMNKKYNVSNFTLKLTFLLVVIIAGYFILEDKPKIEKRIQTSIPLEKNDFKYEPLPCLNSEGVPEQCKG